MKTRTWIGSAVGAAAGLAAYATLVEPFWIQRVHRLIHIGTLPAGLEGLTIGLLSDLHIEGRGSTRVARKAVEIVAAERPDLIAITGDFAEDAVGLRRVLAALRPLHAPLGVYVVPGNHDHAAGIGAWRREVDRSATLRDLTNRYVLLERNGTRLCLGGVDDVYEGRPRLVLPPPAERDATILLAHSPDLAERCRRAFDAVDLVLSGHTHGGQVRLPFLPAPVNSAEHRELYEDGLRRRPWTQVYTSRGLGTSRLPVRLFARPEVTLLTLTAAPRPPRRR